MESIYRQMIVEAQRCQGFKSRNGRDILDFPLDVPMGEDVHDFLADTFDKYYQLIERINERGESVQISIEKLQSLGKSLLNVLNSVRNGKIINAYLDFEKEMDEIKERIPVWNMERVKYYRMRGERNIERITGMYPLPPELRYLSGSVRFSIAGYPCFYFGQSQNVCKREINDTGTMVSFEPDNYVEFKLFDLTFSEDMKNGGQKELNFIYIWPLIASCYINQFYCIKGDCICPPKNIHFYEEYVIPHCFTT